MGRAAPGRPLRPWPWLFRQIGGQRKRFPLSSWRGIPRHPAISEPLLISVGIRGFDSRRYWRASRVLPLLPMSNPAAWLFTSKHTQSSLFSPKSSASIPISSRILPKALFASERSGSSPRAVALTRILRPPRNLKRFRGRFAQDFDLGLFSSHPQFFQGLFDGLFGSPALLLDASHLYPPAGEGAFSWRLIISCWPMPSRLLTRK